MGRNSIGKVERLIRAGITYRMVKQSLVEGVGFHLMCLPNILLDFPPHPQGSFLLPKSRMSKYCFFPEVLPDCPRERKSLLTSHCHGTYCISSKQKMPETARHIIIFYASLRKKMLQLKCFCNHFKFLF